MGMSPQDGISALIRKDTIARTLSLSLSLSLSVFLCVYHMRIQQAQKKALTRNQISQHHDLGCSTLQNYEK